jgi:hypothetical protein
MIFEVPSLSADSSLKKLIGSTFQIDEQNPLQVNTHVPMVATFGVTVN